MFSIKFKNIHTNQSLNSMYLKLSQNIFDNQIFFLKDHRILPSNCTLVDMNWVAE